MLYAGLDLSRKRLDVCVLDEAGAEVLVTAVAPDADALRTLTARVAVSNAQPVTAAIESMTGARFVHDQLERWGWEVDVADAQRAKALAPWRPRPTASTPGFWPNWPGMTWCRPSGCPTQRCAASASGPASGCTWSTTAWRSRTGSTPPS